MLQLLTLLPLIDPVVLSLTEHNGVFLGFGGGGGGGVHRVRQNGEISRPEGSVMANVTVLSLPWAEEREKKKKKDNVCVSSEMV